MNRIIIGDCRDVLPMLEADSLDAIVTDPPYGIRFMGKAWDGKAIEAAAAQREKAGPSPERLATGRTTSGFTSSTYAGAYDLSIKGNRAFQFWCEEWARECLRILKPGAFLLAFGGTRTFHRLACAIEDAGFEIRDCIMWVYGSGFPKSLDVSKAIDKAGEWNQNFDDVRAWLRSKVKEKGLKHAEIDRAIGNENSHMASHFLGISQPMLPTWEQWMVIKGLLGVDEDIDRPPKCIGYERAIIGYRKVNAGVAFTSIGPTELPVTEPASNAAKQWDGWGTALKPAWEPIIVARKPFIGTVAENVLKHGTGALNIGGCRIATSDEEHQALNDGRKAHRTIRAGAVASGFGMKPEGLAETEQSPLGRWPANLIHDGSEDVVELFPQSSVKGNTPFTRGKDAPEYTDAGSAARFFYCAKASKADRDEGCEGIQTKQQDEGRKEGNPGGDNPRNRGLSERYNSHPTVKPMDLMRYLCRLVTPPGGTILDPFAGSCSTGKAAILEGFNVICIDNTAEYLEIGRARMAWAEKERHERTAQMGMQL